MKAVCLALVLLASGVGAIRLSDGEGGAIGKVVTMLKDMLKKSQDDWKSDKDAYEKFSGYCETNTEKKTKAVTEATKTISLLSNKIEEIQGSNGDLSVKVADLKADMAENVQARDDAKDLRDKENKAFVAEEKDLKAAMAQMDLALKVLSDIGADQTKSSGADNAKFMAGYKEKNLLSIGASVRKALVAATSFMQDGKKAKFQAFLQAPFTGSYTAQSGQIVGILKDMKDTFKSNLATSKASEKASLKAYNKFKQNKEDEHADMKKSYDEKQGTLGTNDGDLSTKKKQLQQSKKQKGEDEDFLDELGKQCKDKSEQYEIRKKFATNEEIALTKALAILDNDVSSEKFGAVDATKFIQLSAKRHASNPRTAAAQLLQKAAKVQKSSRIGQILLLLQAGNPFTIVLGQIDKMITTADDEQKVDDDQKKWCTKTNKDNADTLQDKKDNLDDVQGDIVKLKEDINDPAEGLKKQISEAEESLKDNLKNQGDETDTRRGDNLDYQKDMSTMEDAVTTIEKAKLVLKDYYDSLDNEQVGLIQVGEDPAPPKTFEGDYKGQNEQGTKVIGLLSDIIKATVKEEHAAHEIERDNQHDYEDSMESLTKAEAGLQKTIAKLNKDLAAKEKELEAKYEAETDAEKEKIAIERYIEKMKPGCDFVLDNYDARKTSRAAEKTALKGAIAKLKGSPSFKSAQTKAKEDGFGKCKATCLKDEAHAKCKACMAGVSVPGFCAGHSGAKGC